MVDSPYQLVNAGWIVVIDIKECDLLVGGFSPTPFETYARSSKLDYFPKFRGRNKN